MELALVARELWDQKRWLAVGLVVSLVCALVSVYQVTLLPPKVVERSLQYSSASTQAFVDAPDSVAADIASQPAPGISRAVIFANLMASPGALRLVGRDSGIPSDQIWAAGPVDPTQQRVVVEPTVAKRSVQVVGEQQPYRIEFLADPNLPVISVYTQAPTTPQAIALANGSIRALDQFVHQLQLRQHIPAAASVTIRTIGQASGGLANGGITKKLAGFVFVVTFVAWCVLILLGIRFRANWRRSELALSRGARAGANGLSAHGRSAPSPVDAAAMAQQGRTSAREAQAFSRESSHR